MKTIIFLLVFLPLVSYAQENNTPDRFRYEIIKTALKFLSRDHSEDERKAAQTEFDSVEVYCEYTTDTSELYSCLRTYCEEAKIKGWDEVIRPWLSMKYDEGERKETIDRIIAVIKKKPYRINFGSFVYFEKSMKKFAPAEVETEIYNNKNQNFFPTSVYLDSTIASYLKKNSVPVPLVTWLPGIIALVVSIITFFYLRSQLGKADKKISATNERMDKRKEEIKALGASVQNLSNTPHSMPDADKERMDRLEQSVFSLSEKTKASEKEIPVAAAPVNPPKPQAPQTLYAKFPDVDDKGFSPSIIKPAQDGEQIYELEVTGDKGTFIISNNPAAQRYVFNDTSYLTGGCDFLNAPRKGSAIDTKEQGKLIKSGSNWIITDKAKIEFVGGRE